MQWQELQDNPSTIIQFKDIKDNQILPSVRGIISKSAWQIVSLSSHAFRFLVELVDDINEELILMLMKGCRKGMGWDAKKMR